MKRLSRLIHGKTVFILSCLGILSISTIYVVSPSFSYVAEASNTKQQVKLQQFTESELAIYNGTQPELPIYLAYHTKVYDVTEGKKFYQQGRAYHFLAGTDATQSLDIAGGVIITRKYPVVGTLIQGQ